VKTIKKPARQTLPRTALPRIYTIDKYIASGSYPNCNELSEICEISVPTINRDIEFMKDQLGAPIDYCPKNRGYYYTEKTFRLAAGFTTADDLLALSMAKSIFSLYRETPLFEASNNLLNSILTPISSDGSNDLLDKRILVPQVASAKINSAVWDNIVSALKQNNIITFYYQGLLNEEEQFRKVHPYQLLFDSGMWYLYGYSEERKAARIFSLSRILKTRLTKEVFTLPKNYSYNDFSGDSYFGIFIGQEKKQFTIDCYEAAAVYASDRLWAKDQKITEKDGFVRMEFSSTQYNKVLKWVLSCGCYAVPIKPKKLIDDWKWHVMEMKKMVNKTKNC